MLNCSVRHARRRVAGAGIAAATVAGLLGVGAGTAQASTSAELDAAASVLSIMNSERAAHNLPALGMSSALISSAHGHNVSMARADTLSHQLPGEAVFSTRIANAGVNWHSAAENIGWTTDRTTNGANGLETAMYNETAPNDGHRLNILSNSVHYVGIDIYLDAASGKLWLTQDFADVGGQSVAPKPVAPKPVAPVHHNPVGSLDSVTVLANHQVRLTGWAADPDNMSRPLRIAVYLDGHGVGTFDSTVARPDVAKAKHTGGTQGYSITIAMPAGHHVLTSYARNIGSGSTNPVLGKRAVVRWNLWSQS